MVLQSHCFLNCSIEACRYIKFLNTSMSCLVNVALSIIIILKSSFFIITKIQHNRCGTQHSVGGFQLGIYMTVQIEKCSFNQMQSKKYWFLLANDFLLGNGKNANNFMIVYAIGYIHICTMLSWQFVPSHICQYTRNLLVFITTHYLYKIPIV